MSLDNDKIEKRDIVRIDVNNAQMTITHKAVVLYISGGTGDSWHVRDIETNELIYVSEGCTVTLLKKADYEGKK